MRFVVRRSNGRSWAVDRIIGNGRLFTIDRRYFDTEAKARAFQKMKEAEKT